MKRNAMTHPGRLLKRELTARALSASRLALDIGVPSGRITDILNGRRSITADTAVRLGRYFGNSAQFWLDLQGQFDIAMVEREHGAEIIRRVRREWWGGWSAPNPTRLDRSLKFYVEGYVPILVHDSCGRGI